MGGNLGFPRESYRRGKGAVQRAIRGERSGSAEKTMRERQTQGARGGRRVRVSGPLSVNRLPVLFRRLLGAAAAAGGGYQAVGHVGEGVAHHGEGGHVLAEI